MSPKSPVLGKMLIAFIAAYLLFSFFFLVKYLSVILPRAEEEVIRFIEFRSQLRILIPFIAVFLIFLLSLWVYSLYVDMNNLFTRFDISPGSTLLWVILPVINIFGFGRVMADLVNYLDYEDRGRIVKRKIVPVKYGLILFYSCFFIFLVSVFFTSTVRQMPEFFFRNSTIGLQVLQLLVIWLTSAGLIMIIVGFMNVIRTAKTIESS